MPLPQTYIYRSKASLSLLPNRTRLAAALAAALAGAATVSLAGTAAAEFPLDQRYISDQAAPGLPEGVVFDGFRAPAIQPNGDLAFWAILRNLRDVEVAVTNLNDTAIFGPTAGAGSPLGPVVRENDAAGTSDHAVFGSLNDPSLNASGDVAFFAGLRTGTGPAVTDDNNTAIFGPTAGAGSALGLIAREEDPAGTPDETEISGFDSPSVNDAGDVAFRMFLRQGTGPDVTVENNVTVVGPTAGPGSERGIILRGSEPAGTDDDADLRFVNPISPINNAGQVAVQAFLKTGSGPEVSGDNDMALLGPVAGPGSPLGVIIREGEPAGTEDDAIFVTPGARPGLNNFGDVAFKAWLNGPAMSDDNNTALFGTAAGTQSPLSLIAREGATAGTDDDAEFDEFDLFRPVALSDTGDLAFLALLRTGTGPAVTEANDYGLFAFIDGELDIIVREGDLIDVFVAGDEDLIEPRMVERIALHAEGLSGHALAVELEFTDGSSGIYTATIPEPASAALAAAGMTLLIKRRRK